MAETVTIRLGDFRCLNKIEIRDQRPTRSMVQRSVKIFERNPFIVEYTNLFEARLDFDRTILKGQADR